MSLAGITAHNLFKKTGVRVLIEQTDEIFKTILAKINDRHVMGASSLEFDLPDTFSGPFERDESQLYVYSELIKKIEERGFKVELYMDNKNSKLTISWPSLFDEKDKVRMRNIIKSHLCR